MPVEKFHVSMSPDTYAELMRRADKGERSTQITRGLDRYYAILAAERRQLAKLLSDGEVAYLCDVFNGSAFWEPVSVRLAWANVEDALEDGYAQKWEIDGPALVTKIRMLDYAATVALVDAVEMWWQRVARGEQPHPTVAEVLG